MAEFFEQVFARCEDEAVERLVLDVRYNGGGNNFFNRAVIHGSDQERQDERAWPHLRPHRPHHLLGGRQPGDQARQRDRGGLRR